MGSTLPWLHVKMVPVAAALGLIAIVRLRGRTRLSFVAVAALAALGYVAFFQPVFGRPTPLAVYGGHLPPQVSGAPLRVAARFSAAAFVIPRSALDVRRMTRLAPNGSEPVTGAR